MSTASTQQALDGLRVVDFTRQMSGPYASMVLADFGADVVKVESAPDGDPARRVGTHFVGGEGALYLTWNRNKRSICVDLREPDGLAAVRRLIAQADVLMENYRPGVADRIGIGYEQMRELNPRLIYCSTNAFGSKGPWRGFPGTDPVAQAMSGIMSVTGERDGGPVLVGTPVADYTSAMLGAQGVLLALAARERTGEGQHVEVSMLASVVFGHTTRVAPYLLTGENPTRFGSQHSQVVPYQAFQTADGYAVAGVWGGDGWGPFCEALGIPELARDERYATPQDRVDRRDELTAILQREFRKRTTRQWQERFTSGGVLFSPVNTFSDVLESEQARANELTVEVEHPTAGRLRQIAPAVKLSDTPGEVRLPPPLLGQHSREILVEAGFSEEEVTGLLGRNVVVQSPAASTPAGAR